MKFALIVNACTSTFQNQFETLNGFMEKESFRTHDGQTIVISNETSQQHLLAENAPTSQVHFIQVHQYQPEIILEALANYVKLNEFELLVFPGDFSGEELSVRLAFRLGGSSLTGVSQINRKQDKLLFDKRVYSNHLIGSFELKKKPYCISLQKGAYEPKLVSQIPHQVTEDDVRQKSVSFQKSARTFKEEKVNHLANAAVILAVGQGVGSKHAVENLAEFSQKVGAELAVSRPVAMSAWAPMSRMVGVSGTISHPDLCLVIAASGAAAFMAGVEKSRFIVSINQDPQSQIIKQSDVAVVADYQPVIAALSRIIDSYLDHS